MSDKWQPIKTAPKTGTFLGFDSVIGVYQAIWDKKIDEFICLTSWGHEKDEFFPAPTHWMPLPDPPKGVTR